MRKFKENILKTSVYLSAAFTVTTLIVIVGYIFMQGIKGINPSFLFSDYSPMGGGGILPMIVSTVYMVLLSIIVATPIGILSAIYLQEYAKKGRLVTIIRFATESLAGIPSIIYGLFGGIFFVVTLGMKYSILSGALTVAIIILPVIIRTTEESLKTVPQSYREASLALGSTKFQTLYKVVLPSAIPGILSGVILSVGRVIGESAAILLTAGTVAQMPGTIFDSARTLTVHAYLLTKEKGDIQGAAAIGIVLIIMVLILNTLAKVVAKKLNKANY
ncbi:MULTISPECIES: phosphate ABC transporter permease PstA [Romboutsia]|uniref:Phosphate transport system permease protein PstA n=1 Tax=Romboutsia hominis TaxID=1507512 RepID=A0A2P2BMN8_9FIRM|nr:MULTISPECIES: phosphate ABC transporter permease PstA [Romboutsia]MCH1958635.1 phosphate ABC transporter permease PstA [Romboutsia hominis]MCH1970551.1 phosphate ABC transporter permease PstA [Romboutsia hominis]MDB8789246.1 phosphate ABC transporter permease PstA [Romboutsia sp. 1001216sp1]MDB8793248.1 phosphate ABC transporter permease PstA [Romboutsia sp. 1001216sp1]MDB8796040.1 phosphate ABC transporter permease PstA [Romboutsia sp. 1001216sp1]